MCQGESLIKCGSIKKGQVVGTYSISEKINGGKFMKKMELWRKKISSFERLEIIEAQELYKKAINCNNRRLKKIYMDKLILGTLYVVYEYVEKNNLYLFSTTTYDINDIMSAFVESWIKKLNNGDILKVKNYTSLLNRTFFTDVYSNISGDEISMYDLLGVRTDYFIELFMRYIESINKGVSFEFKDIFEKYNMGMYDEFEYWYIYSLIPLFEKMYGILNIDKDCDLIIGKTKLINYLKFIINMTLADRISDRVSDMHDIEKSVLEKLSSKQFVEDVDRAFKNERHRQVIHMRFGLGDDPCLPLEEVSKTMGITEDRVRQNEAKALRILRGNKALKQYIGGLI